MKIQIITMLGILLFINLASALSISINSPIDTSYYNNNSVLFNITGDSNNTIITNLDNSLVAWWRMDEINSSGGIIDYFGRSNGTNLSSYQTTGKFGKGINFTGNTNSYASIPTTSYINTTNTQNWTISLWAKEDNMRSGYYPYIFSNQETSTNPKGGLSIRQADSGIIIYAINSSGGYVYVATYSGLTKSVWYHTVLVYNGTSIYLYTNGIYKGVSPVLAGGLGYTNRAWTIGGVVSSGGFNGTIDDVMIFNRTLTQDEIFSLYNSTSINHYKNLSLSDHKLTAYIQNSTGDLISSSINFNVNNNCWNKLGKITFIPKSCSYKLNKGNIFV